MPKTKNPLNSEKTQSKLCFRIYFGFLCVFGMSNEGSSTYDVNISIKKHSLKVSWRLYLV